MLEKVEVVLHEPNGPGDNLWTFTGKNLLEVLTMNGYQIGGYCAGQGSCGKCKVRLAGKVNPLTTSELQHLLPSEIKLGYRLACCCMVQGPLKVFIDFQDTGISKKPLGRTIDTKRESRVETRKVFIPGIDIDSPVTLYSRLAKALPGYQIKLGIDNLNELSKMDRIGRPALELNALILDQRAVIYMGRDECGAYGVALDLGTTSLFSALVNLQTGATVAIDSKPNMQRIYGADVVSRLSYCMENSEGLKTLQKVLVNTINSMMEGMCREVKIDPKRISQLSIVGNPVMLHFLMGLNPAGLAASPYIGLFEDEYVYNAQELGINTGNNAELVILPQVGGFIGADTIACLITLPSVSSERFLLLDIGTNGEIV
ncbi:MAG: 2Fe-2S iron-sulfur cluster binding domain-containing protein, partial [Syntrophomonadaceae bacterium]|nr:2Fe-2S iron-sulfur cluster binding domain-containing protein [Syntrophomonadaceae bacterium]